MKYKFNYSKLRGRIVEKYGTIGGFANAYGKSRVLVSEKLNNISRFNTDNIVDYCKLLEIPTEEIGAYFFKQEEQ